MNPEGPDFLDSSVEMIEKDQERFRHVLPLHRLDRFQRRHLDGQEIGHGADLGQWRASGAGVGAGHGQAFVELGVFQFLLECELELLLLMS